MERCLLEGVELCQVNVSRSRFLGGQPFKVTATNTDCDLLGSSFVSTAHHQCEECTGSSRETRIGFFGSGKLTRHCRKLKLRANGTLEKGIERQFFREYNVA